MKTDQALAAMVAFERYDTALKAQLLKRAELLPGVSPADFEKMATEMGGVDKVEALARALPEKPTMTALILAFGDATKLGGFVQKTLGGNASAMAMLADKGCKRDAAKLALLAQEFDADPTALKTVLEGGGLGGHPEALAEIFANGCAGDPKEMVKFCKTFGDDTKREQLRGALDEGGLGQAPAALGALAQGDGGALLLKVADKADKASLKNMLLSGGMGGKAPDHPGTLKSVLNDALGGDPARLKELHDAFPHVDGKMPELETLMRALNGKSADGAVNAGGRMKGLMDAIKVRQPLITDADLANKLHTPFYTAITTRSSDARGVDGSGDAALKGVNAVLAKRADPPAGRLLGAATDALKDDRTQALLDALTTDPAARDLLTQSRARVAGAEVTAKALDLDVAERLAGIGASEATTQAIDEAKKQTEALQKKPDGGTPAESELLTRAAQACFDLAQAEPGAALRKQATEAGTQAIAEAKAALKRQAEKKIAGLATATAQLGSLAAAGTMKARIKADPDASPAEKEAMNALVDAAAQALTTMALASQVPNSSAHATQVRKAMAEKLGKTETSTEVNDALDPLKKAAERATAAALSLHKAVKGAEPPVAPGLLVQASAAAEAVVRAAQAVADTVTLDAALDAGKKLSELVAQRGKETAAAAELSLACAQPEAKPGLLAASDIAALEAAMARDQPPDAVKQQAQRDAALVANRSAIASADLARLTALGDVELAKAAKAQAGRQAAIDGKTAKEAETAADVLAQQHAAAAKIAADALTGLPVLIAPALIETAAKAAEEAVSAAAGAIDKTARDLALSEGKRAATAAARALADNAKEALRLRNLAKKAKAEIDTNASRAAANHYVTAILPPNRPAIKAALDTAMSAISEAGAAQLAELAKNDLAVQNARADAAIAAAKAARPGAGYLTQLKALKADAEAQEKLATLAVNSATNAVGGLPLLAAPTWPPAGPPHAKVASPLAPTEDTLRSATILCDAAIAACVKWVAAAVAYKDGAREYLRLAALVPELERSAAEALEHDAIKLLHNNGAITAQAPKMKADADAKLLSMNVQTTALSTKATALMAVVQIARINFNPPRTSHLKADTTIDPAVPGLENAAAFAAAVGTKAFKTVNMPDGSKLTTPPSTADSLLATGTNTEKKGLPADIVNPSPPPPRLAVSATMALGAAHPNCQLNLVHMAERHCRTHFTFDPSELMPEEDALMMAMLTARTGDLARGQANDTPSEFVSPVVKDIRNKQPPKTTTLWPEGITPDHIAAAATLALANIKTDNATGHPFQHFVWNANPKHQHSKMIPGITVGPLTLNVSLGVSATGPLASDTIKVVMFYPLGQESLIVSDCHTLKQACGI